MKNCPNCGHTNMESFITINNVPVNSCIMLDTPDDAISYPTGDINLNFCNHCCFISNISFNEDKIEYSSRYEDQQAFSDTFNTFQKHLVNELIYTRDITNKTVMEIGCGKGDFLKLLCRAGNNKGIGIDPAIIPDRFFPDKQMDIELYRERYSLKHSGLQADFICCRHTLEHIQYPQEFVRLIKKNNINQPHIQVFFEVPDTTRILEEISFQDIYYEHCSYFLPYSLACLFESCGFHVEEIKDVYDGQYLLLFATLNSKNHPISDKKHIKIIKTLVNNFADKLNEKILYWRNTISNYQNSNKNIVIWGSGSKCVAFLKTLNLHMNNIEIVDINPHKQGKYMPGIVNQVKSPDSLNMRSTDLVIIMNKIYEDEIREQIGDNSSDMDIFALD